MDKMDLSDAMIWQAVVLRDLLAFEELVRRYQAVVSGVAYNVCGNVAESEEIAQEAFLVAWQTSDSLREPHKVKSWLCGISRNLARNVERHSRRSKLQHLDAIDEPQSNRDNAFEVAAKREEDSLVWQALEEIPGNYREVLILYYREENSVANVAQTLGISEDAVKQRLSRGREMLRSTMELTVEGELRRMRPSFAFTMSVMSTIAILSGSSKAAAATTTTFAATTTAYGAAKAAVGTLASGAAVGMAGALAGSAVGLAGGWLGTLLPAQLAPTNRERQFILKTGRRILIVTTLATAGFIAATMFLSRSSVSPAVSVITTISWIVLLQAYIAIEVVLQVRAVKKIRRETPPESDPNNSSQLAKARTLAGLFEGRRYQSQTRWLGLPLMHFNVSDPPIGNATNESPQVARGWIAVGDKADGILLAVGDRARGLIAIGGKSFGIISIGGLSIGIISIGGIALGVLSLGGFGMGLIALGGLAIGWQACGGGALAWDFACGGAAAAFDRAYGGAAWSGYIAVGGYANAPIVNDPAARTFIESHWMVQAMKWQVAHNSIFIACVTASTLLLVRLLVPLFYRRRLRDALRS